MNVFNVSFQTRSSKRKEVFSGDPWGQNPLPIIVIIGLQQGEGRAEGVVVAKGLYENCDLNSCTECSTRDRIERMNWTNELLRQLPKFLAFFLFFLKKFSRYEEFLWILQFSRVLREIPTKFHQNLAEKWQNSSIFCWNEMNFSSFWPKFRTIFCWNFEICAVQKYVNLVDLEKYWKMRLLSLS